MDLRSLSEQEKDIRDLLRRAERTPVKTSALRRDTLRRLIDLAHSPHTSLKVIAATNLKLFIKDFPELEDDAINAVYDLCEDPVSTVRIKGYAAIVDVSREQNKWVKRNADVLVQLLQSDEPEEVTFVKRALTQHLDMDPVITIGVLCDQIVPPDEPLDEEEQSIRDRLRSLVLAFLAGEAKRPLVERHANAAGTPAEQVLVSGLFKAITKLNPADVDVIVKDVISALPSFRSYSARGKELLDLLLGQIRATFKTDLPSGDDIGTLSRARYHLDLASFVSIDKRLAHPSHLLRFYYASLTPKSVLRRLTQEDQAYVIAECARLVTTCDPNPKDPSTADVGKTVGSPPDARDDTVLRRQFPDVCAVLLETFGDMKSDELRPWAACLSLVQAIARRKHETSWPIPQHVISALRRLESLVVSQDAPTESRAAQEEVHSVIRSILEPIKSSSPATPSKAVTADADGRKGNVNHQPARRPGNGDAHVINGIVGERALSKGEQRRVMNVNKRKHEDSNGRATHSGGSSGSRHPVDSDRDGSSGRPASLPPRPSAATVSSSSGAPNGPRADRQRDRQAPPHFKNKHSRSSPTTSDIPASAPGSSTNVTSAATTGSGPAPVDGASLRSTKRPRTEERGGHGGGDVAGSGPMPSCGKDTVSPPGAGMEKGQRAEAPSSPRAEEAKAVPSLLSRLGGGPTNGTTPASSSTPEREQSQRDRDRAGHGRRGKRVRVGERDGGRESALSSSATVPFIPSKRSADEPAVTFPLSHSSTAPGALGGPRQQQPGDPDKAPAGGYSIRGAARAASRGSPELGNGAGGRGLGSLLERMQAQGDGGHGWDGGRRKKRTKHQ